MVKQQPDYKEVAYTVCASGLSKLEKCYEQNHSNINCPCYNRMDCRITEKTSKQIDYVKSPIDRNIFLKACPGAGKTEVIGIKAAYEMQRWKESFNGMAVLTFTNTAADEITQRVQTFTKRSDLYPHYIGTFDSWLHSYLIQPFGYRQALDGDVERDDLTMNVLEEKVNYPFLSAYRVKRGELAKYGVNGLIWDPKTNKLFYNFPSELSELKGLSRGEINLLIRNKRKVWGAGFFTYSDANSIGYLLAKTRIGELLSARFPFVTIDECQDLSLFELNVLEELVKWGTKVHLVGDLDQAIFAFKKAKPEYTLEFISNYDFSKMSLDVNFRSMQPIVDVCTALLSKRGSVKSGSLSNAKCNLAVFEYCDDTLSSIPRKFEQYLKEKGIPKRDAVIVTRSKKTLGILGAAVGASKKNAEKLAFAIKTWQEASSFHARQEAFKEIGQTIVNLFLKREETRTISGYPVPLDLDAYEWRLVLADVLNQMVGQSDIINLELSWTVWTGKVRQFLREMFCPKMSWDCAKLSRNLRAPNNKGEKPVIDSLGKEKSSLRATTIHDIKGDTVGALLLVSEPGRGSSGYFGNWIKPEIDESKRLAYVASSRPIHTLVWAVPQTGANERKALGNLGFKDIQRLKGQLSLF